MNPSRWWGWAALSITLLAFPGPPAANAAGLPPVACVEALRRARIETDRTLARQQVEAAIELPGCELPALAEILQFLSSGAYSAERGAALRARLAGIIENPARPLPSGIVTYLAAIETDDEADDLLVRSLEQRVTAAEKSGTRLDSRETRELLTAILALQDRRGRFEAAREVVARLMALEPSEFLWRFRALEFDYRLERWESLAALLESPELPSEAAADLRYLKIIAWANLGRFDAVIRELDALHASSRAIDGSAEETPESLIELLIEVGWALRDAERDSDAEAIFRRVLALDPDHEAARAILLHLYGAAGEREAHAAAVAERREKEDDPGALFEEGSQLLAAGDVATARELLARAAPQLGGTPLAEPAWYNLGLASYKLERWTEAADAFAQAATINSGRPETHFQRGMALYRAERCAEAVPALRRALELKPERREARYYLAWCLDAVGERDAAAVERELYQKSKPAG